MLTLGRKTLLIGLGLLLFALVVNAGVSYWNTRQVADSMRLVSHSHETIAQLKNVEASITNAQTGQRGFLLTGDESYLEPYNAARLETQNGFQALQRLVADNPAQLERFQKLVDLYRERFAILKNVIEERRRGGLSAAVSAIATGEGERVMRDVRSVIGEMMQEEEGLLDERSLQAQRSLGRSTVAFYITLLAEVATIVLLYLLLKRYVAVRKKADKEYHALRALVTTSVDNIFISDREGRYTHVSDGGARAFGMTPAQMIGKTGVELGFTEESQRVLQAERKIVFDTGKAVRTHMSYVIHGQLRHYDFIQNPIFDDANNVVGIALVSRDITDQKHREEQLEFLSKASELLTSSLDYETTLKAVAELVVPQLAEWCTVHVQNDDGTIEQLALAHADPERLEFAKEFQKKFPPQYDGPTGIGNILRTGKPEHVSVITDEMLVASSRGPEHLAMARSLNISSYMAVPMTIRGRALGVISFLGGKGQHFTEKDLGFAELIGIRAGLAVDNARLYRQAQEAYKEVRMVNENLEKKVEERTHELLELQQKDRANLLRLQNMFAHLPMAAIATDEADITLRANEQFTDLFKLASPDELLGTDSTLLLRSVTDVIEEPEAYAALMEKTIKDRRPISGLEVRFKDGRVFLQDSLPIFDEDAYRGQLTLFRDITREKRIDIAKSEFMSLASHQLRTPLTAVRWAASRLQRTLGAKADEYERRLLDETKESAARMSYTIDTMLQIARLESGEMRFQRSDVAICALLSEIAEREKTRFPEKVLQTSVACFEDLIVRTDPSLLREILVNIVNNAMKYTPDGGTIRIIAEREAGDIVITVQDSGYGIPKHQQASLFRKFFRGDNVVDKVTEGTGLGLYLVSLLTSLLGGSIECVSEEGRGTTFKLAFHADGEAQD